MNPKERMRRALRHEPVDRLPTQINYTGRMGALLAAYYDVTVDALPAFLDNHMLRVDLSFPARFNADRTQKFDWWGVGFDTGEEGYFPSHTPLTDAPDLDTFAWPDPRDPDLLTGARAAIDDDGGRRFITPNFGWALFERAWSLRGLDTFLMDLILDPGYAGELLDRIAAIQLALIDRFLDLGVDGAYFGDDYGAQKNMLISPDMWRTFIKPRLDRLFAPFRERGLPIIMHSDGQIQPILPDLVEIGLTALNPVQPEVLDHVWLRREFGGRLAFYGGVSTQTVLPFGTPDEVDAAVRAAVTTLAPAGTGLVIAPSHRMMGDISLANVDALLAAMQRYGG